MITPYENLTEEQKFAIYKMATSLCTNIKSFEQNAPSSQTLTEYGSNTNYILSIALGELRQIGIDDELPENVSMYTLPQQVTLTSGPSGSYAIVQIVNE